MGGGRGHELSGGSAAACSVAAMANPGIAMSGGGGSGDVKAATNADAYSVAAAVTPGVAMSSGDEAAIGAGASGAAKVPHTEYFLCAQSLPSSEALKRFIEMVACFRNWKYSLRT